MCRVVVLSMAFPYSSMHLCTRAQPTKACPRLALPYSSMPTLGFALSSMHSCTPPRLALPYSSMPTLLALPYSSMHSCTPHKGVPELTLRVAAWPSSQHAKSGPSFSQSARFGFTPFTRHSVSTTSVCPALQAATQAQGHRGGSVSLCPALQAATQAQGTQGRVSIYVSSFTSCNTNTGDTGAGQYRCAQPCKLQHKQ